MFRRYTNKIFSLAFLGLLVAGESYSQCTTVISTNKTFNQNKICAAANVDLTYSVTFISVNNDPIRGVINWGDGNLTFHTLTPGTTSYTIPVFVPDYPPAPGNCEYELI